MAATAFLDLNTIDLNGVVATKEQIYQLLPHRYEFMQLDRIVYFDKKGGLAVALREVREDEFWVKGHIPGRPLLPGVLMLETAAHVAAYCAHELLPGERFLGFGGVEGVKFRGEVVPPAKMYFILKVIECRKRRTIGDAQGFVDGKLVFEGRVIGLPV